MKRSRKDDFEAEIRSTRKQLCKAKQRVRVANSKIQDIDMAIRKLQNERRLAVRAKNELFAAARKTVLPYSQACSQALSAELLARLPREVRDMVYAYLWPDEFGYDMMVMTGLLYGGKQTRRTRKVHIIDPSYVGTEMAREVVEALYQNERCGSGPFYGERVFCATSPNTLRRLICDDTFGVGLDPATHLRSMSIKYHIDKLMAHDGCYDRSYSLKQITRSFSALLRVVKKRGFELEIELTQQRVRLNMWNEWFEALRPILSTFEECGATVTIKWNYDGIQDDSVPNQYWRPLVNMIRNQGPDWRREVADWMDSLPHVDPAHREYMYENEPGYRPEDFEEDETDEDYQTEGCDSDSSDEDDDDVH
ncbi:hypothetical protein EJ07DRAFT_176517 [Lizonia empirigonia]|nr:hypothetical protein EJ07DRAFT_176517 [Lizonia empirigonia]